MDNLSDRKFVEQISIAGDTPTLRLLSLLELIASQEQKFSLQSLVDSTDLPKPTLLDVN